MSKKVLTMLLAFCMVLSVSIVAFAAGGTITGSGTEADPYLIEDLDDLIAFRNSVNSGATTYNAPGVYVALGNDIDMASVDWSVNIGDDANYTFDGIFDGQGYTIYNLNSTETAAKGDGYFCTGLFGAIYDTAVIKNLNLENVSIDTATYTGNNVGAVVGFVWEGTGLIDNVTVTGDIQINAADISGVGAIVGYAYGGSLTISDCVVEGADGSYIDGAAYVGGVIGYAGGSTTVDNCCVVNMDMSASCCIGGVAGLMQAGSVASENIVEDLALEVTHANWQNSAAVIVGTMGSGTISVSGTDVDNVTINGVEEDVPVGSTWKNHPDTPVAAVQASVNDTFYLNLDDAIENVQAGDTLTVYEDAQLPEDLPIGVEIIANGGDVTIGNTVIEDGDSYTIPDPNAPVEPPVEPPVDEEPTAPSYPPFVYNPSPNAPMIGVNQNNNTTNTPADDANPNTGATVMLSAPIAFAMLAGVALITKRK